MIENLLRTCGLNETELQVFVNLLERGRSIASVIAKNLNLKRPTVYAALEQLVQRDLVLKDKQGKVTYFFPVSPKVIPKILKNRAKYQFETIDRASNLLEKQLEKYQNREDWFSQNVTFESLEAIYDQLENSLLGGNFWAVLNPAFATIGPAEPIVLNFLKKTAETKPEIREILVAGERADFYRSHIKNPNHQVKLVPENSDLVSDFILLDGSVIMLDYDKKNRLGIKITHQNHYNSMRAIFQLLWDKY